jgi:CBS domain containing-hemolysin-like protein
VEWLLLAVCVLLVASQAVFVAAEFSFVTVDRLVVEAAAEAGDRRSRGVLGALKTLSTQLSGAQLGITVTSLVVGFLAEPSIAVLISTPLTAIGVPESAVGPVAVVLALLIATAFQMVMGELIPKNLAIARPLPVARAVAGLQTGFTRITGPLIKFLNGSANLLLRRIGVEPSEELAAGRSPAELVSLVRRSAEVGTLEAPTAELLDRSLHFGDRTAADVLTPRRRVRFVDQSATVSELVELARRSGHSRFRSPVRQCRTFEGVVELRSALRIAHGERDTTPVSEVAEPPVLVPETLGLDVMLQRLRTGSGQLAVVIDEYGGTAGIVSLEDLVEELIGEVEDEHDRVAPRIRELAEGRFAISALLRPDEVDQLGILVPESDEYETLGGFVNEELGRIARAGDVVSIPGWQLEVTRMDGLRIDWLRAEPKPWRPSDKGKARDQGRTREDRS